MLPPGPVYNYQTPGLWGSTRTGLGTCQNIRSLMTGRALQFSVSALSLTHFGVLMPGMSHSYFLVLYTQSTPGKRRPAILSQRCQRTQSFHIFSSFGFDLNLCHFRKALVPFHSSRNFFNYNGILKEANFAQILI